MYDQIMETETLRPTYRKRGTGWEGVLKDSAGKVAHACGHHHLNRDQDSHQRGASAVSCAWSLLRDVAGVDAYRQQRGW